MSHMSHGVSWCVIGWGGQGGQLPATACWCSLQSLGTTACWCSLRSLPATACWCSLRSLPATACWCSLRSLPATACWCPLALRPACSCRHCLQVPHVWFVHVHPRQRHTDRHWSPGQGLSACLTILPPPLTVNPQTKTPSRARNPKPPKPSSQVPAP